jgi:flagellin-like protein
VSEVITAVILIAIIFVLGLALGYLVALFSERRK